MKIFLDTACIKDIELAMQTGMIDGITTNPTLLSKYKKSLEAHIAQLIQIVPGPISIEAVGGDAQSLVRQGKRWYALSDRVVVKVPITLEGLKACRQLSQEGIPVNATLCFSAMQALLAAKAGARYVSPFVGRLDDTGSNGAILLETILQLFQKHGFQSQILAASLRHPLHVLQACLAGADIVTLPPSVFYQLYEHPLTQIGLQKFHKDWALDEKWDGEGSFYRGAEEKESKENES